MLALRSLATRAVGQQASKHAATKSSAASRRSGVRHVAKKIVPEYSPHVTIYKFPLPAIVSISNRFAGIGLAAGFTIAGALSLFSPAAVPALLACIKSYPIVAVPLKGAIAFALSFHWIAGIRHLVWDNSNWGLDSIEALDMQSKVILGASSVITLGAMFI